MTSPNFMNGVPELLILRALESREMYGYELMQMIGANTNQAISLSDGAVYSTLHALEGEGMLKSRSTVVSRRKRIYYALTHEGERHLASLVQHWRFVTQAVEMALAGVPVPLTPLAAAAG